MKYFFFLVLLIAFTTHIDAQNKFPPERVVVIANLENDKAKTVNYSVADLNIESKISRMFKLELPNLKLFNPTLLNEGGNGWFLQYEFESNGYVGLWKEQLQLKKGQLVITESRSAMIGLASNCEKIQFTNDLDHCKCVDKTNAALESSVKYRLFSSMY
jgi:hypothetical protein